MKKPARLIKTSVIVPLLIMTFNVGDLRCQEDANMLNAQYKSEQVERGTMVGNEDNMQEEKNIRVRIIEMVIKRNLFDRYQEIDEKELEARLH